MGKRIDKLIDDIRAAKGPFFVARLNLRLSFPVHQASLPDRPEHEQEIIARCQELGYELLPKTG